MPIRPPMTREEVIRWAMNETQVSPVTDLMSLDIARIILEMQKELESYAHDNTTLANYVRQLKQQVADYMVEYDLLRQGMREMMDRWAAERREAEEKLENFSKIQEFLEKVAKLSEAYDNREGAPICGKCTSVMGWLTCGQWHCFNCGHTIDGGEPEDHPDSPDLQEECWQCGGFGEMEGGFRCNLCKGSGVLPPDWEYPIEELRTRIGEIKDMEASLLAEKEKLQDLCVHDNGEYRYIDGTDNYDPSMDSYSVWLRCKDCGKSWHVDSEKEDYYRIPHKDGWAKERNR